MLLHDRTNTSSEYLVKLQITVHKCCKFSALIFAKINYKGNPVNTF